MKLIKLDIPVEVQQVKGLKANNTFLICNSSLAFFNSENVYAIAPFPIIFFYLNLTADAKFAKQ